MKYISVQDFYKETIGKSYDMDHAYGVQCVDGIKKFAQDVYGESNFTCGNGWAYGLWTNYGHNGVEKYFKQFPFSEVREGDWVIWNKGSKQAPTSHVGMFLKVVDKNTIVSYGQNQGGKKEFNKCNVSTDGILGVLRPNIYLGYVKGNYGKQVKKIDEFLANHVKGNYYGDYTEACVKVFQRQNELMETGIINDDTLEKMKEQGLKL